MTPRDTPPETRCSGSSVTRSGCSSAVGTSWLASAATSSPRCCPRSASFGAQLVAERMRVAMHSLVLPTGPVRITVGWSAAPAGADPPSVWQRADESLYKAKRAGGDRVAGSSYEGGEAADIAERSYSDVVARFSTADPNDHVPADRQPRRRRGHGLRGARAARRASQRWTRWRPVFEAARTVVRFATSTGSAGAKQSRRRRELPPDEPLFLNISAAALLDPVHGVDQLLLLLRSCRPCADDRDSRDHRARAHSRLRGAGTRARLISR